MSGIIAAAVAVIGTLPGAVVAHRYQEKTALRSAARAGQERGHQRLLDACAGFVASGPAARRLAEQAAEILTRTREISFAADRADTPARGEAVERACEAFTAEAAEALAAEE